MFRLSSIFKYLSISGRVSGRTPTNTPPVAQKKPNHETPTFNAHSPNPKSSNSGAVAPGAVAPASSNPAPATDPLQNQSTKKPNLLLKYLKNALYATAAVLSIEVTARKKSNEAEKKRQATEATKKKEDFDKRMEDRLTRVDNRSEETSRDVKQILKEMSTLKKA